MSLSRRRFTQEFKLAAVERLEQGASAAEVSRAFEVNPNLLHRWRRELRQGRGNAFPGEGKRRWEETRSAEPAAASPTGSYYEPKGRRWPAKTSERSTVSKLFVSPQGASPICPENRGLIREVVLHLLEDALLGRGIIGGQFVQELLEELLLRLGHLGRHNHLDVDHQVASASIADPGNSLVAYAIRTAALRSRRDS